MGAEKKNKVKQKQTFSLLDYTFTTFYTAIHTKANSDIHFKGENTTHEQKEGYETVWCSTL